MRRKTALYLTILVSFLFLSAGLVLAEEVNATAPVAATPIDQAVPALPATPSTQNAPDTQWVWGEVVNFDIQNKTVTVKYLDYETDQEKEIIIASDDKTAYENLKSIDDLKLKDTVSIDYIVGIDGRNTAKNISLEKAEETMPVGQDQPNTQLPAAQQEPEVVPPAQN